MEIDGKQKHRIRVRGRFSFKKLPKEQKEAIIKRIGEKDPEAKKFLGGEVPGLKINGEVVNRESIKKLEISKKIVPTKIVEEEEIKPKENPKMSEGYLFGLNKAEQVEILKDLGSKEIPRLESGRVALILKLQKK